MSHAVASRPVEHNLDRPRVLSKPECRALLRTHHEGRLGYRTGRGPRAVVVSYAVTDDQIVFQLPDYTEIPQYSLGEQVSLEVDAPTPSERGFQQVRVTGRAHPPADPSIIEATQFPETWPPGVCTRIVCLDMSTMEGANHPA